MKSDSTAAHNVRRAGIFIAALLLSTSLLAQKQTPPASSPPADAAPSSASKASTRSALDERQVPFEELKNRIGQRVVIRTTNHTTRSGILTTYDNFQIDIKTDKEQGGFALSIPRDTIQSVSIMLEPVSDPLFPTTGKPGAKKN